jgi:DNA-binding NarL/FixJ family response regulator
LTHAVREVAGGGSVIDPKVVDALLATRSRFRGGEELSRLTRREREVLGEMAQGKDNSAIARSLAISQRAVEKHINSIFCQLGLSDMEGVSPRVRAVLTYLANGTTL